MSRPLEFPRNAAGRRIVGGREVLERGPRNEDVDILGFSVVDLDGDCGAAAQRPTGNCAIYWASSENVIKGR